MVYFLNKLLLGSNPEKKQYIYINKRKDSMVIKQQPKLDLRRLESVKYKTRTALRH